MPTDERPHTVIIATWLIVGSVALSLITVLFMRLPLFRWSPGGYMVIMLALGFAIWARQNWARFVFLILFLLGLVALFWARRVLGQLGLGQLGAQFGVMSLLQTIMQVVALGCLFARSSNEWFRGN